MAVNSVMAGPLDLFIPEYSGRMTGFIREKGRFKVLDYCEPVRSVKTNEEGCPIAVYFALDTDDSVRIGSLNDFWWAPGTRSPSAKINVKGQFHTVQMERAAYPYEYSGQTKATADMDIGSIYRMSAASVAMTAKTLRVSNLLETASNWAGNVADANTLNSGVGNWKNASADEQSPAYNAISKTFIAVAQSINLSTNSVVSPSQLRCVIAPELAGVMATSGEMTAYLKGSPFAKEVQEGGNDFDNTWSLPKKYKGIEIIVEDASLVGERPIAPAFTPATTNRVRIKRPNTAWFLSKVSKLDGVFGAPSFSTVQIFYYRFEMSVMEKSDSWHDLHEGKIVDQFKETLVSPVSGYLVTNCQ